MILQKMPHYVDSILTQEDASAALQDGQVVVGLYTNRENVQSVVHSHPYYEMILPVAGSSVRYSVDGSVYDLHLGELILFPGEMYHSGKFNITDTTSERLVVQIAPGIWERAWAQSGLPRHVWSGDPVILDTDAVTQWDFRGLLERMAQTVYLDEKIRDTVQCCEVTELILLISQVVDPAAQCPAALGHQSARRQGGCLPSGQLHRPASDRGPAGKVHLHQPGAPVPRVQRVHAGKYTRVSDQPAYAALPQRARRRHRRTGRLHRQRFCKLQQLFKELPRTVRHHPRRVPRPTKAEPQNAIKKTTHCGVHAISGR